MFTFSSNPAIDFGLLITLVGIKILSFRVFISYVPMKEVLVVSITDSLRESSIVFNGDAPF